MNLDTRDRLEIGR